MAVLSRGGPRAVGVRLLDRGGFGAVAVRKDLAVETISAARTAGAADSSEGGPELIAFFVRVSRRLRAIVGVWDPRLFTIGRELAGVGALATS